MLRSRQLLSHASEEFWKLYYALPAEVQEQADKQFALFRENPFHPSLRLKQKGEVWSARVSRSCRALAYREGNVFYWFWIGGHDDYEEVLRRLK